MAEDLSVIEPGCAFAATEQPRNNNVANLYDLRIFMILNVCCLIKNEIEN
jgi:hypothetical protein